jgi:hypothetical protein
MKLIAAILLAILTPFSQQPVSSENPLLRHYHEGEKLTYHMRGINEGWWYQADANGVVKKDASGFFEEYAWTNFVSRGQKVALAPEAANFRQRVTLDLNGHMALPDLSRIDPRLIGPMTDFLTFYADLWLAEKSGKLLHPGDHSYVAYGKPSSWADGKRVVAGQSAIDFDITFQGQTPVKLPAEWMRKPVSDTANNWFEVQKTKDGYSASVGKETFEVRLIVSAEDGKILSATMYDTLIATERACKDAALQSCGETKPHTIHRQIEMQLVGGVSSGG